MFAVTRRARLRPRGSHKEAIRNFRLEISRSGGADVLVLHADVAAAEGAGLEGVDLGLDAVAREHLRHLAEVLVVAAQAVEEDVAQLGRRGHGGFPAPGRLQPHLEAVVHPLVLVAGELERVDVAGEHGVRVDDLLDVRGVELRAVEGHGQVAAPVDVEQGEAAAPRGQPGDTDAARGQFALQLLITNRAAHVAQVVAYLGGRARLPADGEEQLAFGARLDDVVEGVVLEDHRRRLAPEEGARELAVFHAAAPQVDGQLRLDADVDFEVGGAVGGDDRPEVAEQVGAHRLGDALAAHDEVHVVAREVEPRGVDERLDEGRVAEEQVAVAGAEEFERVFELLLVGAERLEDAHVDQRHRDVHARGPRPEREAVEQDAAAVAVDELVVELEDALHVLALGGAAHPVVRHARRARRLVYHHAGRRQPPVVAARLHAVPLHVILLRHHRQPGELPAPPPGVAGLAQKPLVGRAAPPRLQVDGLGAQHPDAFEQRLERARVHHHVGAAVFAHGAAQQPEQPERRADGETSKQSTPPRPRGGSSWASPRRESRS